MAMNEDDYAKKELELENQKQNISFLQNPPRKEGESVLSKHLEATDLLEQVERLLMGFQFDSQAEEYKPILKTISQNGQMFQIERGALIDPDYVRLSIGYLKSFLNSNVFLSYIESIEQINAVMWDVNIRLTRLLHPLKNQYDIKTIDMTYA